MIRITNKLDISINIKGVRIAKGKFEDLNISIDEYLRQKIRQNVISVIELPDIVEPMKIEPVKVIEIIETVEEPIVIIKEKQKKTKKILKEENQ